MFLQRLQFNSFVIHFNAIEVKLGEIGPVNVQELDSGVAFIDMPDQVVTQSRMTTGSNQEINWWGVWVEVEVIIDDFRRNLIDGDVLINNI
ncbi:hypothetical protein WICPIJ_005422 [Wickerhamomyces pijperi]|uniref:Uncharacterized protein n=1 Tax=Wickerhamomyces pijperi TaxID=599730 RepID=A0A9P8Q5Y6_WICPI|nr:hypothetical protein WICPIJ_005422 [Wickerhamomyces pijperi]